MPHTGRGALKPQYDTGNSRVWEPRMASKSSFVAGQLLQVLALHLKLCQASPLTPMHIAGKQNAITDIPSRSFGSKKEWHCKNDDELLQLFNQKFPLPAQNSWTVFRPGSAITTRVLSVLRMKHSTLEEWRRLPKIGKFFGSVGTTSSRLWEWTLTFRVPRTTTASGVCPASPQLCEQATMAADVKSKLEQFRRRSQPLARRSPWPAA